MSLGFDFIEGQLNFNYLKKILILKCQFQTLPVIRDTTKTNQDENTPTVQFPLKKKPIHLSVGTVSLDNSFY